MDTNLREIPTRPWTKEDEEWFFEHYADIAEEYAGHWVAVRDQRVVAYYDSGEKRWVPVDAEELTVDPDEDCLTFFIERGVISKNDVAYLQI